MKEITLGVPNNMFPFFMQLVENLKFVKVKVSTDDTTEPSKQEILKAISEGINEVKLYKQGKIKLKSARQLLNEL
jgi:hypothetical protein